MAQDIRQTPWPFDCIINGNPYMLAMNKDVPMWMQTKLQIAQNIVTPAGAPYVMMDPKYEAPRGFFRFQSGVGFLEENIIPNQDTSGYYYGLYVAGAGGDLMNGPAVTTNTPATTGAIKRFFEVTISGTRYLCALASRYVLIYDGTVPPVNGSWTVSKDLGAGVVADRVATFRGTQSSEFTFVAIGTGAAYWAWSEASTTTVWTQTAVASPNNALAFVPHRDALWRLYQDTGGVSNGYKITKAIDGGEPATWGAGYLVSDLSNPASDLSVFNDVMYIATERGIRSPDSATLTCDEVTPFMVFSTTNGKGLNPWYNWLIVPMAGSLFRLIDVRTGTQQYTAGGIFSGGYQYPGEMTEFGLGTLERNSSEVQGRFTAGVGYRNWCYFAVFYNDANNNSYLMQWGEWYLVDTPGGLERIFLPIWQGALYKWTGSVTIDAMYITNPSNNPVLWMGGSDGNLYSIILPRFSMDWRSDSRVTFNTTNPAQVYLPRIYHGIPHENKVNHAVVVRGENLTGSTRFIDVTYRTDATSAYGNATNLDNSGRVNADSGGRLNFVTPPASRSIDFLDTLTTTTAATPAVMKAHAVYQTVVPIFKWVYQAGIRLGDGVTNRIGQPMQRFFGEQDQVAALETAGAAATLPITTPRNVLPTVILSSMKITEQPRQEGKPPEWLAMLEMVEHKAGVTVTGTYARLEVYSYGILENYTYGQLEAL